MKLSPKEIQSLDVVGKAHDGSDVMLVVTKGGHHQMLKKKKDGEFKILGAGAHRAVARVMANNFEKNIAWHQSLFKTEDMEMLRKAEESVPSVPESKPENHVAQAVWHASNTNTQDSLSKIHHTLSAIAHCQAAGLDKKRALELVNNTLKKLNKNDMMDQPFDGELLKIAWEKKHNKPFPVGE